MPMPRSCITMLDASTAGVTPRSLAASAKASSSFRIPRSSPDHLKISEPSSRRVTLPIEEALLADETRERFDLSPVAGLGSRELLVEPGHGLEHLRAR